MTSSEQFGGAYPTVGDTPVTGGYAAGAYVPPAAPYGTVTDDIYHAPTEDDQPSTADVAKGQAASVAGGAADAAQHVAGVAKEQAGQVTAEATRQVKHLVGQARTELSDQASTQQGRAASGLHAVGDQLKSMAQSSQQPGVATDLAHQAADKVHEIAGWLENREPADVLDDVRRYARQRPGMFLAMALGAGIVAGRLARGMTADPEKAAPAAPAQPVTGYPQSAVGYAPTPALSSGDLYGAPAGDLYGSGTASGGLGDLR